jgi:hypothetical protein
MRELREKIIDGHRPTRHGGLGFGGLACAIDRRVLRIIRSINSHELFFQHVHVPHNASSGSEVVCALLRHHALGSLSVVAFASHFNGEHGCAFEEQSAFQLARVKGSVRAERAAAREVDDEADVVGKGIAALRPTFIIMETDINFTARAPGTPPVGEMRMSSPFTISALPFSGTR